MAVAEKIEIQFGPPVGMAFSWHSVDLEDTDSILEFVREYNELAERLFKGLGGSAANEPTDGGTHSPDN